MTDSRGNIVKTYQGTHAKAIKLFQADALKLGYEGYFPTSQSYVPGSYGCGSFLFALLLCLVVIGIFIFIYMLIVKPAGTLTVTYEYTGAQSDERDNVAEKTCPKCAEAVKEAAKVCRFCGYEFP